MDSPELSDVSGAVTYVMTIVLMNLNSFLVLIMNKKCR
jgi:hypothetical protein